MLPTRGDRDKTECDAAVVTTALAQLEQQLLDVDNLISRHPNRQPKAEEGKPGPIRRPKGEHRPLLRSCVFLTYAAWEVYAEDSVVAAVETLTTEGTLRQLPSELKNFVATTNADPWALAGDGWRKATLESVTFRVRGDETSTAAGSFGINSAGPGQLMALHQELFGEKILNRCSWKNKTATKVKQELASLIEVRGSIAHTGKTPGSLNLAGTESWRNFIWTLGQKLDAEIDTLVSRSLALPA